MAATEFPKKQSPLGRSYRDNRLIVVTQRA